MMHDECGGEQGRGYDRRIEDYGGLGWSNKCRKEGVRLGVRN